jgi:hypothetical protein
MVGLLVGLAVLAVLLSWGTPLQTFAVVNAVASLLANAAGSDLALKRGVIRSWIGPARAITGIASAALVLAAATS